MTVSSLLLQALLGRTEDLEDSLQKLRGPDYDISNELSEVQVLPSYFRCELHVITVPLYYSCSSLFTANVC
jgi:hypothetical protein